MPKFAEYRPCEPGPRGQRTWSVRPAEEGDLEELAALGASREGAPAQIVREGFRRELACIAGGAPRMLWVAVEGGRPIAYARASHFERPYGATPRIGPEGWYLSGQVVEPEQRRRGVASDLTSQRMQWLAGRARECFAAVNACNRPSLDLLAGFGFRERTRDFELPRVRFEGGVGVLLHAELP